MSESRNPGTPKVLPPADFRFPGEIGRTYADSDPPQFPQPVKAPKGAPNVVLLLIDDCGFGQYGTLVACAAYLWGWPMVNIYNRRLAFDKCPRPGLMNGVLPFAPLNTLSMRHDYVAPDQRWVECPNQDVVYGAGIAALERSPVVVLVGAAACRETAVIGPAAPDAAAIPNRVRAEAVALRFGPTNH